MRNLRWIVWAILAAGCTSTASLQSKQQLNSGYQALEHKDYNSAIAAAEQFLHEHPSGGPGTAEALYLEGRVYEERATSEEAQNRQAQAKLDLQTARETYVHALSLPADPKLTALIHAGVANTAYFQEDYSTAMNEWAVAYPDIPQPDAKAWTLYRIGLCQQRLGRFDQADRTFATVRQNFPTSVPAQRAAEHIGARAFYVQVGAYADSANADRIVASLQSQGYRASKSVSPSGRQEVLIGPAYNYADAKALLVRLQSAYQDAMIEP
ncbi:MAG TPA: SPOR domain-containing protein [Tepidisphaeraceae bacterium]|nr:SPOR domain-containing protein [Tepidisphaeraceae bacterium]